jgi:cyclase
MKSKHILYFQGFALLIGILCIQYTFSQSNQTADQLEPKALDNKLTIYSGGGGNSGILVTDSAVVVIDTKMGPDAGNLASIAKQKAGNKKIIVINTHYHRDHTTGNSNYKGSRIYIGAYDRAFLEKNLDPGNMPTDYVKKELKLNLGDETVHIFNVGQAHTFDDVVVFLEKRKVMFTGDLVFNNINPVLKKESGADVGNWIFALNGLLMGWEFNTVVPGHGPTGTKDIIIQMREYLEDMQDAAENPGKADNIKMKYKDWFMIPGMSSPDITIDYIRGNK